VQQGSGRIPMRIVERIEKNLCPEGVPRTIYEIVALLGSCAEQTGGRLPSVAVL
jgi:hypothetical protein